MSNTYFSKWCCSHPPFRKPHTFAFVIFMGIADVLLPLPLVVSFGELRLIAAAGADSLLVEKKTKTLCAGFHTTGMSIYGCGAQPDLPLPYLTLISTFPLHLSPPLYCSSLSSPLPALSRAVMGLDRESDVVHIETRIAKGRECCTPVHRSSKTHRTLCLSFRVRSRGRWDLFCWSDWTLKSSKAE